MTSCEQVFHNLVWCAKTGLMDTRAELYHVIGIGCKIFIPEKGMLKHKYFVFKKLQVKKFIRRSEITRCASFSLREKPHIYFRLYQQMIGHNDKTIQR